ncbi:MAG TPA: alpha/beta fold hydrolase [Gemmatimonadales bacterium]|nr:alpha/beta fold hydrolase [Gemmatimonadales bacterium]
MLGRVGERVGQFEILEKVGEGGMGEVFRAQDTKLGREVALKFLTRLGQVDPAHAERLKIEARALAGLNHVNIVTIYDIGEAGGVPFLVLEWLPGRPLSDASFAKPCDEARFFEVAIPVAEALAAAHAGKLVHRDVKPGNVLLTQDGRVKLVDFGLAKLREGNERLTETSAVMGTVRYMSPEQASGAELGPPSDVFSFGVLAYEMLTGLTPFARNSTVATLHAIVHDSLPALAQARPALSPELAAVVERCLLKDPERRFPNGSQLALALHHASRRPLPVDTREQTRPVTAASRGNSFAPKIQFCRTTDGAGVAFSVTGSGPVLLRVLGWFTHLEMEWEWPGMRLIWERLAQSFTVVRYDGRGIGLSDPWEEPFTEATRQLDIDAVMNAVGASRAVLLGISEGGWSAATYAYNHPERISHLVVYGGYSRGGRLLPDYDPELVDAFWTLVRKGWGKDTPLFRRIFTMNYFGADADPGLVAHFNQLQRASADPETAFRFVSSYAERGEGAEFMPGIRVPTLVAHCRDDKVVPFEEGRRLASLIPGAELLPLPTGTHYFPIDDQVTALLADAIARFAGIST